MPVSLLDLVKDHHQWLDLTSLILSLADPTYPTFLLYYPMIMASQTFLTWNLHYPTAKHSLIGLVVLISPYVCSDRSMIGLPVQPILNIFHELTEDPALS